MAKQKECIHTIGVSDHDRGGYIFWNIEEKKKFENLDSNKHFQSEFKFCPWCGKNLGEIN